MRSFFRNMTSSKDASSEVEKLDRSELVDAAEESGDASFSPAKSAPSSGFSFFSKRNSSRADLDQVQKDVEEDLLSSAAQTLSECIEEILSDSASLSGENMSGFIMLIRMLENKDVEIGASEGNFGSDDEDEDKDKDEEDDGELERSFVGERINAFGFGSIQVLLNSKHHPNFVEVCNKHHLVVNLVQAMRLLKIFEIKLAKKEAEAAAKNTADNLKSSANNSLIDDLVQEEMDVENVKDAHDKLSNQNQIRGKGSMNSPSPAKGEDAGLLSPSTKARKRALEEETEMLLAGGSTKASSARASELLEILCSAPGTLALLDRHQTLEKLLTYPLTALPEKALHLQKDIAKVISIMCRNPFSSEQVWLLHDSNMMQLMVKGLKELAKDNATVPESSKGKISTIVEKPVPVKATGDSKTKLEDVQQEQQEPEQALDTEILSPLSEAATPTNFSPMAPLGPASAFDNDKGTNGVNGVVHEKAKTNAILKGIAAEEQGLWILGINSIVDIITATVSVNPVLLTDFENVGGYKLLVHVLSNSSQDNCMQTLMSITRLLTDPFKGPEEAVSFPTVGAVVLEVLVNVLQIRESVEPGDRNDMLKLARISQGIIRSRNSGELREGWEMWVQNIAYVLLTLYSNQPQNCILLEEPYQFLPILLLTIPALENADAVTATLTALNFVCECVEDKPVENPSHANQQQQGSASNNVTTLPLMALCASTGVCVAVGLNTDRLSSLESAPSSPMPMSMGLGGLIGGIGGMNTNLLSPLAGEGSVVSSDASYLTAFTSPGAMAGRTKTNTKKMSEYDKEVKEQYARIVLKLDLLLGAFDSICSMRRRFPLQVLRSGFLPHVMCPLFENLREYLSDNQSINAGGNIVSEEHLFLYRQMVGLLLSLQSKTVYAAEEMRQSGFSVTLRNLIRSDGCSLDLMENLLLLPEALSRGETTHLQESMQSIFDLLQQMGTSHPEKKSILFQSMCRILEGSEEGISVWENFNGFDEITHAIVGLRIYFHPEERENETDADKAEKKRNMETAFHCLRSALECFSLASTLIESDEEERRRDARRKCVLISGALRDCGVIQSPCCGGCIYLLMGMLCGFSSSWSASVEAPSSPFVPFVVKQTPSTPRKGGSGSGRLSIQVDQEGAGTNASSSCAVMNYPEASLIMLEILPLLLEIGENTALHTLLALERHSKARFDGEQQLAESGFVLCAIERYHPLLRSREKSRWGQEALGVRTQLLKMISSITACNLTLPDFTCILKYLVRAEVVYPASSTESNTEKEEELYKLLSPFEAYREASSSASADEERKSENPEKGKQDKELDSDSGVAMDLLLELAALGGIASSPTMAAPYISLGQGASVKTNEPAHLEVPVPDVSKLFNGGCTSFTMWFQCPPIDVHSAAHLESSKPSVHNLQTPKSVISDMLSDDGNEEEAMDLLIPIASFCGVRSTTQRSSMPTLDEVEETDPRSADCFVEVLWHIHKKQVILYSTSNSSTSQMSFEPTAPVADHEWTHIGVSLKKTKRFGSGRSSALVFMNGSPCKCVRTDPPSLQVDAVSGACSLDLDIPSGPSGDNPAEVFVGKSQLPALRLAVAEEEVVFADRWHLGPLLFFDSPLSHAQISYIFVNGPSFSGMQSYSQTHDSPLTNHITSLSADVLGRCTTEQVSGIRSRSFAPVNASKNANASGSFTSTATASNTNNGNGYAASDNNKPDGGNQMGQISSQGNSNNAHLYSSKLAFDGLQHVVDPVVEKSAFVVTSIEIPSVPAALFEYNARNAIARHTSLLHDGDADLSLLSSSYNSYGLVSGGPVCLSTTTSDSAATPSAVGLPMLDSSSPLVSSVGKSPYTGTKMYSTPNASAGNSRLQGGKSLLQAPAKGAWTGQGVWPGEGETDPCVVRRQLKGLQVRKLSLMNSMSLDDFQPVASVTFGWHLSVRETFASCVSALGGPSVLFPLLQVASSELVLCQALLLLRLSTVRCPANLKYMQTTGFKILAFIMTRKPGRLLTARVMDVLFAFCSNEELQSLRLNVAAFKTKNENNGNNGNNVLSLPRSPISGLLLVDTVALYQLLLNHRVWSVASYDHVMSAMYSINGLSQDYKYGILNSHRLSSLGVVKWVLLLCAYAANRATGTETGAFSMEQEQDGGAAESESELELASGHTEAETETKTGESNTTTSGTGTGAGIGSNRRWPMARFENVYVSNGCNASEPFLDLAMNITKSVMRVELRRKDVELISFLVMYTFIPARPMYVDSDSDSDREFLSTFSLLRVYLLRLLFTLYDDGLADPIYRPASPLQHSGGANGQTPSKTHPSRRPSATGSSSARVPLVTDIEGMFRSVFRPDWFLSILEKVSDQATFADCLRLLSLFLQKDAVFQSEFASCGGFQALKNILVCQPQELSVILPLLAMFFQIPTQILPFADQAKTLSKLTQLLDLEESAGPALSEPALNNLSIPVFRILMECVVNNAHSITSDKNKDIDALHKDTKGQGLSGQDTAAERSAFVCEVLLGMMNYAYTHVPSFKEFMQHRVVISIVSVAAIACSDVNDINDVDAALASNSNQDKDQDQAATIFESESETPLTRGQEGRADADSSATSATTTTTTAVDQKESSESHKKDLSLSLSLADMVIEDYVSPSTNTNTNTKSSDDEEGEEEDAWQVGAGPSPERAAKEMQAADDGTGRLRRHSPVRHIHEDGIYTPLAAVHVGHDGHPALALTSNAGLQVKALVSGLVRTALVELNHAAAVPDLLLSVGSAPRSSDGNNRDGNSNSSDDVNGAGSSNADVRRIAEFQSAMVGIVDEEVRKLMDVAGTEINVYYTIANSLSLLVPLSRAGVFPDVAVQYQLFELATHCLTVMLNYFPGSGSDNSTGGVGSVGMRVSSPTNSKSSGSVFQILEPLIKDFGTTARAFAVNCTLHMVVSHEREAPAFRARIFCGIRKSMSLLLANTFEDSASPLEQAHSKGGLFGFGYIKTFDQNDDLPLSGDGVYDDTGSGSGGGGSFSLGALFKTANSSHSGTHRGTLAAKSPSVGSGAPPRHSMLHSGEALGAVFSQAVLDKARSSAVFCATMMSATFCFLLDDDSDSRIEAARTFTLLAIHKRGLVEHLLSKHQSLNTGADSQSDDSPGLTESSSGSGSAGLDQEYSSSHSTSTNTHNNNNEEFFFAGLEMLAPSEGMLGRYETFLRGLSEDNDGEEHRMAAFSFWLTDNKHRCDKTFDCVDSALRTYTDTHLATVEAEEVRLVNQLRIYPAGTALPLVRADRSVVKVHVFDYTEEIQDSEAARSLRAAGAGWNISPSTAGEGVGATMQRAEEALRCGEQLVGHVRWWRVAGLSHAASGGLLWHKAWTGLQTGPVWGYLPVRAPPHMRLLTDNEGGGDMGEQGQNWDNYSSSLTLRPKVWRVAASECPERTRRRLEQCYFTSTSGPLYNLGEEQSSKRSSVGSSSSRAKAVMKNGTPSSRNSRNPNSANDRPRTAVTEEGLISGVGAAILAEPDSPPSIIRNATATSDADEIPPSTAKSAISAGASSSTSESGLREGVGEGEGAGGTDISGDNAAAFPSDNVLGASSPNTSHIEDENEDMLSFVRKVAQGGYIRRVRGGSQDNDISLQGTDLDMEETDADAEAGAAEKRGDLSDPQAQAAAGRDGTILAINSPISVRLPDAEREGSESPARFNEPEREYKGRRQTFSIDFAEGDVNVNAPSARLAGLKESDSVTESLSLALNVDSLSNESLNISGAASNSSLYSDETDMTAAASSASASGDNDNGEADNDNDNDNDNDGPPSPSDASFHSAFGSPLPMSYTPTTPGPVTTSVLPAEQGGAQRLYSPLPDSPLEGPSTNGNPSPTASAKRKELKTRPLSTPRAQIRPRDGPFTERDARMRASEAMRKHRARRARVEGNRQLALQELVRGFIGPQEWADAQVYNIKRIAGLELHNAIAVLSTTNLHILSGFRVGSVSANKNQTPNNNRDNNEKGDNDHTLDIEKAKLGAPVPGVDAVVEWVGLDSDDEEGGFSSGKGGFSFSPPPKEKEKDKLGLDPQLSEEAWLQGIWSVILNTELGYYQMPCDDIYSIFKRRHQLKYTALEITDTRGFSLLFSCQSVHATSQMLVGLLEAELPSSIFRSVLGAKNLQMLRGASHLYNRLMATFVSSISSMWERGQISNFEYLMHLNAASGRSCQDLTQYPIFPWVLADYESEELNLSEPSTFRDLSKPMGALGEKRASQFRERYSTLAELQRCEEEAAGPGSDKDSVSSRDAYSAAPPPFFYGTHYSCAGYVLHYLCRLQPYADMSISLQGGRFDNPDRLFMDIAASWRSASEDNLQDVRELIPEFFYCPEFLRNANRFNFGKTQKDELVDHVKLPPWAHGCPHEFVKKHREALESDYVSEHLHHWIDLIFGCKQRGDAAVDAMNVFIHLTYDGEVDVDAITDPLIRSATIAQINNFGQCPSKLFAKPHRKKTVPEIFRVSSVSSFGSKVVAMAEKAGEAATSTATTAGGKDNQHQLELDADNNNAYNNNAYNNTGYNGKEDDNKERALSFVGGSNNSNSGVNAAALTEAASAGPRMTSDAAALAWHEHISPPLCVVGASHIIDLIKVGKTEHFTRPDLSQERLAIADVGVHRGQVLAVHTGGLLLPQAHFGKKTIRFGGPSCGFSVLSSSPSALIGGSSGSSAGSGMIGSGDNIRTMVSNFGISAAEKSAGSRYNSVLADQEREVFSVHERLHESVVTCMAASEDGMFLFTGSADCSVRMWDARAVNSRRKLKHVHSLVAHNSSVRCLDYCAAFGVLVSGADDGTACLWDTRTGRLLRFLSHHANAHPREGEETDAEHASTSNHTSNSKGRSNNNSSSSSSSRNRNRNTSSRNSNEFSTDASAVLSVSMSSTSGCVVLLTRSRLQMFSVNGDLLCEQAMGGEGHFYTTPQGAGTADARVVLAVPTADWQDGVVCVSGHESGFVHCWKVQTSFKSDKVVRTLYVAHTLPKIHNKAVSAMKLISTAQGSAMMGLVGDTRRQAVISRAYSDAGTWDLFVGDAGGQVSRWSSAKLDSLMSSDRVQLVL